MRKLFITLSTLALCVGIITTSGCSANRSIEKTSGGTIVSEVASTNNRVIIDTYKESDPRVNVDFVYELIGTDFELTDSFETSFDTDGNWLRRDYSKHDTSDSVKNSYIFSPIQFAITDETNETAVSEAMQRLREELKNEGFSLAKKDDFSREHYINGKAEVIIWNVSGANKKLEIKATTGAQMCCNKA